MPEITWDSSIVFAYRLVNLREVILHNYRIVQEQEDREDCMVQIEFSFGEINHDLIHMTNDEGEFVELNNDYKDPNSFWGGSESIQFSVEFSEVEEFIEEIKIQMDMINYTGCKLIIKG